MIRLFKFLRPFSIAVAAIFVLVFLQALADLFLPTLMKDIVDTGVVKGDTDYIWRIGGYMLLVAAGSGRDAYEAVTARAVGRLSTLAELASPLLKPNAILIAWKGKRDEEEEQQMARASESLAMRPQVILDVGSRAGSKHRHLHVIKKSGPTPVDLPRKSGMAKKRPKG